MYPSGSGGASGKAGTSAAPRGLTPAPAREGLIRSSRAARPRQCRSRRRRTGSSGEPNAELERTLGTHPAWSTIRQFLVDWFAKRTGSKLGKHLASLGAKRVEADKFTVGIE